MMPLHIYLFESSILNDLVNSTLKLLLIVSMRKKFQTLKWQIKKINFTYLQSPMEKFTKEKREPASQRGDIGSGTVQVSGQTSGGTALAHSEDQVTD